MDFLKHPLAASVITGGVVFILLNKMRVPIDDDRKNKKTENFFQKLQPKEVNVLISIGVAVVVFAVMYYINGTNIVHQDKHQVQHLPLRSLSSEDTNASFNLIGKGIKIPTKELPPVLVDYH